MKSFVALLSIKPHSPSVCPLYATVGAYRTFKYCLPIARLCLTSMVTVTPKKRIQVYNKNWAGRLGFNWRSSFYNTRQNLETLVCFSTSLMLIWVLQSSRCFKIGVTQHWGRRGAHLIANKSAKSECNKFSRKFNTNGVCFNDLSHKCERSQCQPLAHYTTALPLKPVSLPTSYWTQHATLKNKVWTLRREHFKVQGSKVHLGRGFRSLVGYRLTWTGSIWLEGLLTEDSPDGLDSWQFLSLGTTSVCSDGSATRSQ